MELHHAPEINGADDVDIVQKERFVQTGGIAQKKVTGFFQSATGVEQQLFQGQLDVHPKIAVGLQVLDDHPGKVMHIDHDVANPEVAQARERDFQKRSPGDLHQGLGAIAGQGMEARAQSGRQNHGFH